jgi:hypothetical protein
MIVAASTAYETRTGVIMIHSTLFTPSVRGIVNYAKRNTKIEKRVITDGAVSDLSPPLATTS